MANRIASRGALVAAILVPSTFLWLASCNSDADSPTSGDGGCAGLQCADGNAATDGSSVQGDAAALDTGITDAGADVDPYADADPVCEHYVTPVTGSPATVKIVNQTGAPIYLGQPVPTCDYDVGFTLQDSTDASLPIASSTANDCRIMQTDECSSTCPVPLVTKLADGKTYDIGWPGTIFTPRWMPPKCYADAACATGPCLQEVLAPSGTVSVTAYPEFYCGDAGACFDCTVNGNGNCLVPGAGGVKGTPHTARASYAAGASTVIVTIQ